MTDTNGVLILHGFTGSRATVAPVVPLAEELGMRWSLPQLRGHWTRPEDLEGVTYQDMLADALAAFDALRREVDHVAIVGLSVGGLLALDVASRRGAAVEALVTLAPALSYVNPLARFSWLIARLRKMHSGGDPHGGFSDPSYGAHVGNYESFPTATFLSIYQAAAPVLARLPQITVPTLVLGARSDRVVQPSASQLVYDRLGSRHKEIAWFERSGHEMLLDCEAEGVCTRISAFLEQQLIQRHHVGESYAAV